MNLFHFTLQVLDAPPDLDEISDDLYEAGCSDALLCMRGDKVLLMFHREAEDMDRAIESAISDIRDAGFEHTDLVPD